MPKTTQKTKKSQANIPVKYLNPFTDFGFKKLFGEEDSKPILIRFLNAVFEGYIPKIQSLVYAKNEQLGNLRTDRSAIFDLYCKSDKGERFIIELQKIEQTYFRDRTLFYSTFAVQQAKKGNWNFQLSPVYCLAILNFIFHQNPNKYLHFGEIIDRENQEILLDNLKFGYIECPKFRQELDQNSSKREQWLYALTHLERLQSVPDFLHESEFEAFFDKANLHQLSPVEREDYYASEKYYRDLFNIETQNFDKGLAKGIEQGIQQGKRAEKLLTAQKMKNMGLSLAQICTITGLLESDLH